MGDDFLDEVDRAATALSASPLLNRIRFANVRRAAVHRFKFYGIYYTVRAQEVWVLAIFHGSRHPRALHERREGIG
ncbi:MAG: type II toxin-antitoxin system RelE/ParE family toxin [Chthoniobacterales bacterium]